MKSALSAGLHLAPGMRVGLFGGSFNPAHEGHAHVAETALKRLGLDQVIWLVSPQNPLKSSRDTQSLADRMNGARALARGGRMIVSDAETRMGTQYTIDTIRALKRRYPAVCFVWLMGSDSLASFHHWRHWRQILRELPVAVVARPGSTIAAMTSPAARAFRAARRATLSAGAKAPAWTFLSGPLHSQSSSALRRALSDECKAPDPDAELC
ncbi:nicotinate-nucleotide adenylyltransferase [Phenylobacterium immobile]|uniref:nicotinate-nucleotide adenylyltransferase n=1 Tax=Phenylobacterium immobile TaxID=21 RepID=UPI000A8955A1|nr:nicotinate-nucleotide adenylyltransferase [Phenylobacterium immobile]